MSGWAVSSRVAVFAACAATLTGLSACAGETDPVTPVQSDDQEVARQEAALVGGSAASRGTQDVYGLVEINGLISCSGVALDPNVVVTSAHCTPGIVGVTFLGNGYLIDDLVVHPDYETAKVGFDIAVLFLSSPLLDRFGEVWDDGNPWWGAEPETAVGESMFCFGRHTGSYKWGIFDITEYQDDDAVVAPGGFFVFGRDGVDIAPGDSGGPCFDRSGAQPLIGTFATEGVLNLGGTVTPFDPDLQIWLLGQYLSWVLGTL